MAKRAYIGIGGAARSVKKVYIGVHQVPQAQYAVLEYIESTGTQYINTGVAPTDHEVRAAFDSGAYENDAALFGTGNGAAYFHFTEYSNKYYWGRNGSEANGGTWASGKRSLLFNSGDTHAVILDGVTLGSGTVIASTASLNIFCRALNKFYSGRLYQFAVIDRTTFGNIRDYIPVRRLSDGAIGLYDKVGKKFYENAGTGVFTAGAETGAYIFDIPQAGEFACRIKRAYIGVGGAARPFWGGGELARYGAVTPLSVARKEIGSAKTGQYLLFAGGTTSATVGGTKYNNVDVYSGDLVHSAAAGISNSGYSVCGVTVDQTYALFCGGRADPYDPPFTSADAYDADLAKTTPTSLSHQVRDACGIAVGSRAVICGGKGGTYPNYTDLSDVNCYDGSLTRGVLSALPFSGVCTSANVGAYGIVTRMTPNADATASVAYNADLTRTTLTSGKHGGYGCKGKECAVFARMSVSYAYSEDLTQFDLLPLSQAQTDTTRTYLEGFAIFAGGWPNNGSTLTNAVEAYKGTTLMAAEPMAAARTPAGGTVGGFALFAGGGLSDGVTASAEAYTSI